MINHKVEIIGACYGLACPNRDVAKGPLALRNAGLIDEIRELGITVIDGGDVSEPIEQEQNNNERMLHVPEVIELSNNLAERLKASWATGNRPVVLGGDHSIAMATVGVASEQLRKEQGEDSQLGLLWVDAHADINTAETSPFGNIHGMPLATLLRLGDERLCKIGGDRLRKILPENVAYIRLRDLDEGEKTRIREMNITAFTMKEIDPYGIGEVCRKAIECISHKTTAFYLSFDLDVCDLSLAPAVGTPVRGELTYR